MSFDLPDEHPLQRRGVELENPMVSLILGIFEDDGGHFKEELLVDAYVRSLENNRDDEREGDYPVEVERRICEDFGINHQCWQLDMFYFNKSRRAVPIKTRRVMRMYLDQNAKGVHDLYCVKKLREEFSDTIRCKQEKDAKKTAKHGR